MVATINIYLPFQLKLQFVEMLGLMYESTEIWRIVKYKINKNQLKIPSPNSQHKELCAVCKPIKPDRNSSLATSPQSVFCEITYLPLN